MKPIEIGVLEDGLIASDLASKTKRKPVWKYYGTIMDNGKSDQSATNGCFFWGGLQLGLLSMFDQLSDAQLILDIMCTKLDHNHKNTSQYRNYPHGLNLACKQSHK